MEKGRYKRLNDDYMNTILSYEHGYYLLTPQNKKIAKQFKKQTGHDDLIFQTDWDFPALASTLGWNLKIGREKCKHEKTDGTIDCPDCGKKAGDFIYAAQQWLDKHDGHVFRGKGDVYFQLLYLN